MPDGKNDSLPGRTFEHPAPVVNLEPDGGRQAADGTVNERRGKPLIPPRAVHNHAVRLRPFRGRFGMDRIHYVPFFRLARTRSSTVALAPSAFNAARTVS